MRMIGDMKISTKLMLLISSGLIVVSVSLTVISGYRMYQLTNHNLQNYQNSLMSSYDQMIKAQVQTAYGVLKALDEKASSGELSRSEAMRLGAAMIRKMRYGSEGYFWIDTIEGVNVVHSNRQIEGVNRFNERDINGKLLIQEIISKGRQPGGGYSEYWFTREGGTEAVPKRGYSLEFKPFGWVIGTGNYIGDIQKVLDEQQRGNREEFAVSLKYVIVFSLITISLFLILAWLLGRKLTLPLRNCVAMANRIAAGDFEKQFLVSRKDEVGQLCDAMNAMLVNLRTIIDLKRLAQTDALTSANNRGHFMELLEGSLQISQVTGSPLTLMLFDLDHFKKINDTYGHAVGDEALRTVSSVVTSFGLRHTDFWGRLGGEEFAIVLSDTGMKSAIPVAERLRKALAEAPVPHAGGYIQITASIGVAESRKSDNGLTLLNRADVAMYKAKAAGRNRACFAYDGLSDDVEI